MCTYSVYEPEWMHIRVTVCMCMHDGKRNTEKIDTGGPGGLLSRQRGRHVPYKNLGLYLA